MKSFTVFKNTFKNTQYFSYQALKMLVILTVLKMFSELFDYYCISPLSLEKLSVCLVIWVHLLEVVLQELRKKGIIINRAMDITLRFLLIVCYIFPIFFFGEIKRGVGYQVSITTNSKKKTKCLQCLSLFPINIVCLILGDRLLGNL